MKFVIAFIFCFATAYCVDVLDAPTPAPQDFRSEYDHLLVVMAQEKLRQVDEALLKLQRQYSELEQTKDKELKAKIVAELDTAIPVLKGAQTYLEREIARTDLDLLERFLFEATRDDVLILIKQLTALEVKVKAIA